MHSRYKIISLISLAALLFSLLWVSLGHEKTFALWNVSSMTPHFADLRTITHGAESAAQGYDPLLENPADPWGRRMNYPRIWQGLHTLGIDQSHTTTLGILIILTFLIGVCLILPNADNKTLLIMMAAVLSPATLLGIERGNNDLLMFFLTALAIVAIKRASVLSSLSILAAFSLKLFPIFAASLLLRTRQSNFYIHLVFMLVVVGIYGLYNYADIVSIREATPKSTAVSYGMDVFWMRLSDQYPSLGFYARILSYSAVIISFFFAYTALFKPMGSGASKPNSQYLDAFRAGAAIYIGTFLIGNSWDYRLIFLIFTLPQLVLWMRLANRWIATLSKVTLITIFLSLWYLLITKYASTIPLGGTISYLLDETANWLVFAGLLYLFCWSLPDWIRTTLNQVAPSYMNTGKGPH